VDNASLDGRIVSWLFLGLSTLNIEKILREVETKGRQRLRRHDARNKLSPGRVDNVDGCDRTPVGRRRY
jgi:hypothetical protein